MLTANWPYVVNIALFIGYFAFWENQMAWPRPFIAWAWLPYLFHLVVHNFVDGFQNTTRNIARIYLLETQGRTYDNRRVAPLQVALVPRFMVPVTMAWFAAHILSFAVLLLYQGWGTALAAEGVLICFGWVLPINYQAHLKRIQKHIRNPGETTGPHSADIELAGISEIVNQAVEKKRSPQEWWASYYN